MIIQKPVKNFATGRGTFKPDTIVIHIGEGSQQAIYDTFLNGDPNDPKSSHYSVAKSGEIWQFVQEKDTAWGNGVVVKPIANQVTSRPGVNPNAYTISIEHEGIGTVDLTEAQYQATSQLVVDICHRWNISIDRVHIIRHNEIRANKTCPGLANVDKIVAMALASIHPVTPPPVQVTSSKEDIKSSIRNKLVEISNLISQL